MMMTWEHFLAKKYDYSSVQINVPPKLATEIINWGEYHVDNDSVYETEEDHSHGREENPHITVIYGLHTEKPKDLKQILYSIKPFTVKLGKITKFENNDDFDVVKIDVSSKELHDLHQKIKKNLEVTLTHDEYVPHITIAYVKKGKCKNLIDNKEFSGQTFAVKNLVFSSSTGNKATIKINSFF